MATREPPRPAADRQREVVAFLSDAKSYAEAAGPVEIHETHGALVFLVGVDAYKIKRAVHFDYMDFSTLDKRRRALVREIEVNRVNAPDLYLDVVAITRTPDGRLAFGGDGEPLEYALHMRRFSQQDLLSQTIERAQLSRETCVRLGDAIFAAHQRCPVFSGIDDRSRVPRTIEALGHGLAGIASFAALGSVAAFEQRAQAQFERARTCCEVRQTSGFVRRCHGDLHLNNIVLQNGEPRLFDALEFDEELATIDTLYDLAFLLMDLDHSRHRREANIVLNRYVWRSQAKLDLEGLIAMPLFLGLRSAIRALTSAQRAAQESGAKAAVDMVSARGYFEASLRYLDPRPPRLIAIGGLSGTGKSSVSSALAPLLDPAPGAIHLRTDLERKAIFHAGETERLPPSGYSTEATRRTYAVVLEKAAAILKAGHSVVVDAAFQSAEDRAAIETVARRAGVAFAGLWLTAPRETLLARVAARRGDASDATPDVVERQLVTPLGRMSWRQVDAGGPLGQSIAAARSAFGLHNEDTE